MTFKLVQKLLGAASPIEIGEHDFNALAEARSCAHHAWAVEEKYALVLGNYLELEREVHRLTIEFALFNDDPHNRLLDGLRDMNRVLMNLLSSQKTYLDQVPQHINQICGPDNVEFGRFRQKTRDEFDTYPGYSVLAGLRNHAQHQDLPIQYLSQRSFNDRSREPSVRVNSLSATCDRDELLRSGKFSASVRKVLEGLDAQFDVLPLAGQCMSSFARLHLFLREMLRDRIDTADGLLRDTHERFRVHAAEAKLFGLHAVRFGKDGAEAESFAVTTNVVDRRKRLEAQSSTNVNLEQLIVASRHIE